MKTLILTNRQRYDLFNFLVEHYKPKNRRERMDFLGAIDDIGLRDLREEGLATGRVTAPSADTSGHAEPVQCEERSLELLLDILDGCSTEKGATLSIGAIESEFCRARAQSEK